MKRSHRRQQRRQENPFTKITKTVDSLFSSSALVILFGEAGWEERTSLKEKKRHENEKLEPINTHQSMKWLCFN